MTKSQYTGKKNHKNLSLTSKLKRNKFLHKLVFLPLIIFGLLTFSVLGNFHQAQKHSSEPIGAYLVLGGSIMREIHIAQVEKLTPEIPVIISSGSSAPCIYYIFQREQAPMSNVWLENCADSTFTNFIYNIPRLKKWGIKKVGVVTSETHLPRADLLAQILLKSKGIAPELVILKEERGISGNHESQIKTVIDVTRSLGWSLISQFVSVPCGKSANLAEIDLNKWSKVKFGCESRGNVKIPKSLEN